MFISEMSEINDSVLAFDQIMEEIAIEQYLKPERTWDIVRPRYNQVRMLKTFLYSFMDTGYNVRAAFRQAASVSVTYMLMSRRSLEPKEHFDHDDFMSIFDFNTPEAKKVTTLISYQDKGCDVAKESYFDTNATGSSPVWCNRLHFKEGVAGGCILGKFGMQPPPEEHYDRMDISIWIWL